MPKNIFFMTRYQGKDLGKSSRSMTIVRNREISEWLKDNVRKDCYSVCSYDNSKDCVYCLYLRNDEDYNLLRLVFGHKFIISSVEERMRITNKSGV